MLRSVAVQPIGPYLQEIAWPLEDETETSVTNYQFTLCNIPEEIYHLYRGGNLNVITSGVQTHKSTRFKILQSLKTTYYR
jgi:hypothetical protein